jgi:hypothetical protein
VFEFVKLIFFGGLAVVEVVHGLMYWKLVVSFSGDGVGAERA